MAVRKQPKGKNLNWLYSEINGMCPMCGLKLQYEENNKINTLGEAAHIYPLHPTNEEKVILKGVERFTEDVNHRDNFILLCKICHKKFDFPRTVEKYNELLTLKKKIITQDNYRSLQKTYTLEEEIKLVIKNLVNNIEDVEKIKLSYEALKIKEKLKGKVSLLTINRIEREVTLYFYVIREEFSTLEEGDFDIIASQIKAYFRKLYKTNNEDYTLIIKSLVEWVNIKSDRVSEEACELLVYFFIQNCEVFDAISK